MSSLTNKTPEKGRAPARDAASPATGLTLIAGGLDVPNAGPVDQRPQRPTRIALPIDADAPTLRLCKPKQSQQKVPDVPGVREITYRTGRISLFYRRGSVSGFVGHKGVDSYVEMMARVHEFEQARESGRGLKASRMTTDEFVETVYAPWAYENIPASAKDVLSRWWLNWSPRIGGRQLRRVTNHHVNEAAKDIRNGNRAVKGGRQTVSGGNRIVMAGRAIFKAAHDLDYIGTNPADGIRNLRESPPSPRALTGQELQRLGEELSKADFWLRSLVELLLLTGMRVSEARHLKHDDVDRVNGVLNITKPKSGVPETVPLVGALPLIDKLQALRRPDNPYVLHGDRPDGLPMSDRRRGLGYVLAESGIDRAGYHLLRKTWASQAMADPSMDVLTVSRMLRHRSVRTTERHYIATPQERLRKASVDVGARIAAQLRGEANPT